MTEYEEKADAELIRLAHNGDAYAEEVLLQRYIPLVTKEGRFLYIVGADDEDIYQEGMIGLMKAVRDYSEDNDAAFITFATICIRSQIKSAITASNRKKHTPLNEYISIYLEAGDDENDASLVNVLSDVNSTNPEKIVLDAEKAKELTEKIEKLLSSFEKKVLRLYLQGLSYASIGIALGKEEKSINNALTRIKTKLRNSLS